MMSGPGHLPPQTYGGTGTQDSDVCVIHCFFLCLLALWVRAALSNGPAAFQNNVAKCRRTHSLVFGALRGSEVTWGLGGFENRLAYSHYCWLIIALIFWREVLCESMFPLPSIPKSENNRGLVFLHHSMR